RSAGGDKTRRIVDGMGNHGARVIQVFRFTYEADLAMRGAQSDDDNKNPGEHVCIIVLMKAMSRRNLIRTVVAAPAAFHIAKGAKPTDVRIEDVQFSYEDYKYRAPLKFGG